MELKNIEQKLQALFLQWAGEPLLRIETIPQSGSSRKYFRLQGAQQSAIATWNNDLKENRAFLYFSKHFKKQGLAVPEIYLVADDEKIYLQEDLGTNALYDLLGVAGAEFGQELQSRYGKIVRQLAHAQVKATKDLDFSLCYPRSTFDKQSMMWDLNSFKYYFLKLAKIPFDEQLLENDFHRFADYLQTVDDQHFMFRDFQSRNIILKDDQAYFIDYQGGRKGALQYDLASLLYQAKANIPQAIRDQLLQEYLEELETLIDIDRERFTAFYYGYVLIRTLQVLSAYGLRGIHERKSHFLNSIPFAIQNVAWICQQVKLPIDLPELWSVLQKITQVKTYDLFDKSLTTTSPLVVTINSFSYKKGIPEDSSGNGGGFVFDCRSILNPGRYEPYKKITGRDKPVMEFLEQESHMPSFLQQVYDLVDKAVANYIERSFSSLMVSFGCTGGQHRSVYAADALAKHLEEKFGVKIKLKHIMQEEKNWIN